MVHHAAHCEATYERNDILIISIFYLKKIFKIQIT